MGVLADWQIELENVVEPFTNAQQSKGVITHGVSSYGYDVRAGDTFKVFDPIMAAGGIVDPKNFREDYLRLVEGDCVIPPNSFALCYTLEKISVPRNCIGIVLGKSTYARCGIVVNCTPLEPEWRGHVTIEISNTTPIPAKIYANEGIGQILFIRADGPMQVLLEWFKSRDFSVAPDVTKSLCRVSYQDKKGRYQDQGPQVTVPCVRSEEGISIK